MNPQQSYFCGFCHSNKAPAEEYLSHPIRVNDRVVCPTLRCLVCKLCGKTGDEAHTIKYCPQNSMGFFGAKSSFHKGKGGIRGSNGKFMLVDNKMVFVPTVARAQTQAHGRNESSVTGAGSVTGRVATGWAGPGAGTLCYFGAGDKSLMGAFQQEMPNQDPAPEAPAARGYSTYAGSAGTFQLPRPSFF